MTNLEYKKVAQLLTHDWVAISDIQNISGFDEWIVGKTQTMINGLSYLHKNKFYEFCGFIGYVIDTPTPVDKPISACQKAK